MLTLPKELTHDSATACLAQLSTAIADEVTPVRVDAAALGHFDSSALAVLLELRRACLRVGKSMVVQGLPQRLRDLATVYGIESLLPDA
ncbi:MAG: STAS domain-containing protein [Rhodoferax sp.]|nr:STAS domain-containing protein [Rhodoferax sp.]